MTGLRTLPETRHHFGTLTEVRHTLASATKHSKLCGDALHRKVVPMTNAAPAHRCSFQRLVLRSGPIAEINVQ